MQKRLKALRQHPSRCGISSCRPRARSQAVDSRHSQSAGNQQAHPEPEERRDGIVLRAKGWSKEASEHQGRRGDREYGEHHMTSA